MSVGTREAAIAEIGVRLLKGHRMMSEACPEGCNCPLMDYRGVIQCVQCMKYFERDADGELVAVTALKTDEPVAAPVSAAPVSVAPVVSPAVSAPPREAKRSAPPGVGKVGQHLLRGWTMLADHCPRCLSPIMKEPGTNDMWCVECGIKAVNEEQFDAKIHRAVRRGEPVGDDDEDAPVAPAPAKQHKHHHHHHEHEQQLSSAAVAPAGNAASSAPARESVELGSLRQRLLTSLARRLEAACVELEGPATSASARETMSQVRDLVATIKDVQLL